MLSFVHPCFRYGCVHVITCLCGTCMFYERQRSTRGVVLSTLLFEARSLTVIWSLSIRLYWLPVEPQGSFCLCLLSDEITCIHHHDFFFFTIWSFLLLWLLLHEYWQSDWGRWGPLLYMARTLQTGLSPHSGSNSLKHQHGWPLFLWVQHCFSVGPPGFPTSMIRTPERVFLPSSTWKCLYTLPSKSAKAGNISLMAHCL